MVLGAFEAAIAIGSVGIRFENDRVHQNQTTENSGVACRYLHQTVTTHRVSDADGIGQGQVLDKLTHVIGKSVPHIRLNPITATVTAHVNGEHMETRSQRQNDLVPASGMKARGMQQQNRLSVRLAPLKVGQAGAAGLELMLDRLRVFIVIGTVHREVSQCRASRAW